MKITAFTLLISAGFILVVTKGYPQHKTASGSTYTEEELIFISENDSIYGKLILPGGNAENGFPLIVFVHGSGPEDYSSSGNYNYLWEQFTKAGFACFSWDRPGVGLSTGSWYKRSMADRADEVFRAIEALGAHKDIDPARIGLWGISQAGWVIPIVAEQYHPAFVICVSCPVTTAYEQETYRLRSELAAEGYNHDDIEGAIAYTASVRDLILAGGSFEDFNSLQKEVDQYEWSSFVISGGEVVFNYLKVIFNNDHAPSLDSLSSPLLAIWGENDLLVPPRASAEKYQKVMQAINNQSVRIEIINDADHTLTYNNSGKRAETNQRRESFREDPAKIFAPGYLDLMLNWLREFSD